MKLLASLWRIYVGVMFIPACFIFISSLFYFYPLDPDVSWYAVPVVFMFLLVLYIRVSNKYKKPAK